MSVVESRAPHGQSRYPELDGARILITGLESRHGVDIARAFAEQGCRLILQATEVDTELEIVLEMLAQSAADVHLDTTAIPTQDAALHFAQAAVKVFGGLDAVVNLARLDDAGLEPDASVEDIENRVVTTLGRAFRITHVIANRMRLTWKEGLILNIVTQATPETPAAAELGRIARAALAGLTRQEAGRWADEAVRINAIVPAIDDSREPGAMTSGLSSEPEIAALALHLTSKRGRAMSGLVFDATNFPG